MGVIPPINPRLARGADDESNDWRRSTCPFSYSGVRDDESEIVWNRFSLLFQMSLICAVRAAFARDSNGNHATMVIARLRQTRTPRITRDPHVCRRSVVAPL